MFAPTLTIIQHHPAAPAGHLPDELGGVDARTVHAWKGEAVPTIEGVGDALIVLGGPMGVHDVADAPWLPATGELLAAAVEREIPTLAIGLGFQLLVQATGGRVAPAAPPGWEAGLVTIKARPAAALDPVFGALFDGRREVSQPTLHRDAVVALPSSATWLAQSAMYPYQAARIGTALGIQFHPEADFGTLERWASRQGLEVGAITAQMSEHGEPARAAGARLLHAFAAALPTLIDAPA